MRHAVLFGSLLLCLAHTARAENAASPSPVLTLQEAVEVALSQHPTLRMGQATIEAAQQRVRQQMSGYLPSGGYTYTYSRQERPLSAAVGGAAVGGGTQQRVNTSQTYNFNSTNFSLNQVLFDFGRTLDSIRSAVAAVDASTADLETTRQGVAFNTRQAYYTALSAQRLLQVAQETVQQNQKHVEEAQARFEVGLAPRFDVTQAQVQLSNADLGLVVARHNVSLSRETLRTALGILGPFPFTLVDTLERDDKRFDEDALIAQAYANRPELRSLHAQEHGASEQVSALQKQYLPSVSGTAQYNWTGREYPLQQGWVWGVTLSFPLFDDIETMAQVGEAAAILRNLRAQEDNLRLQIVLDVRQSVLGLYEAEERIRVSEQTLVQAQENLALAEGRYTAGVGNIIEVTDAQTSLTLARASNIQALYTYKTALAQVERAVGQRLE